jgi:nucleoside phosphorylase
MFETNSKTNILIVTVATVESEAVIEVFREATGKDPRPESIGDRMYHELADVEGVRVFLALSEMGAGGLGASQQAVQKGIDALDPSAVIMVGIAFGVNEQKQAIGDILVSRQLWLYDLQRIGKNEIIPRGDKPHASTWLIDRLRGAEFYWKGAKVHFGLVLTGEKLVDNLDYRDQLKQFEAEAIGGEMEGAGLYVACQDRKVDWILVKAICDWADGNKRGPNKDSHQVTAAHNAASFVLHALQLSPLKREAGAKIDRGKDEQNDVQILVQTDKLLTSLRALDNAIHLHVGELTSCDLDSLTRERNELIKQISDFAQREELIDDVRESLRTLEVLQVNANKGDQALVTKIFECGADILRVLSNSPVTPFPDTEALRDFVMRIKKAQDERDVQEIIREANKVLNVLDRGRLGAATEAYGTLKGQIQLRYPKLLKLNAAPQSAATVPQKPEQPSRPVKLTVRGIYSNDKLQAVQPWREIGDCRFLRDSKVDADPVFDLVVENTSCDSLLLLKTGIRILQRKPERVGGVTGYAQPIKVQAEYSVHCYEEWKRCNLNHKEVWKSFEDPMEMKKDDSPFRFTLRLENFCDPNNASSSEIRFCLQTSSGTVESESIWLEQ